MGGGLNAVLYAIRSFGRELRSGEVVVCHYVGTLADGTEADVRPDNGTLVYSNAAGFAYNNSTTELLRATLRSFSEEGEFTNDADKVLSLGTGGKAYAAARSLAHSLRRTLSDAASPHPLYAGTPTTARSISTRRRT